MGKPKKKTLASGSKENHSQVPSEGKGISLPETEGPMVVVMDRRSGTDRRSGEDRRKRNEAVAVERRQAERRAKVPRRRQIDPTTCERDYTPEEIEFMRALDEYKRSSGRMFPTCSEILEVLRKLGYEKRRRGESSPPASQAGADSQELSLSGGPEDRPKEEELL